MPPEQQLQLGALEQGNDTATLQGDGNPGSSQESAYQRVSVDEAATLPYEELKRRMREERRLAETGSLPDIDVSGVDGADDSEDDDGGAGQEDSEDTQGSGGNEGGGAAPQDSELQKLLRQAQERAATLERERADEKKQREQADMQAQHRRVEEAISQLPQAQQELARREYMNRMGTQALNEYHGWLQERDRAIQQQEIAYARRTIPAMLEEVADSVAQRHGLRNADPLKQYVRSPQFADLLAASNTEDALTAAAANAGQWMEFLALQQATQNAQARETRRVNAATSKKVVRDTPTGGVPTAGGDMDLVRRINTMTREEFFAWKKQQLKEARASQ